VSRSWLMCALTFLVVRPLAPSAKRCRRDLGVWASGNSRTNHMSGISILRFGSTSHVLAFRQSRFPLQANASVAHSIVTWVCLLSSLTGKTFRQAAPDLD